ncbi:DUF3857 domain-containing protein [Massilia sp. R2A-15]|uniref:DUF3857 domain-containing protein n=1 Tax=Massilia sp. R2A-15 TaxID=3064278 RepID=UPI0027337772|nr:DUF3857 domain-containing protein [Massilia sp. R2A-15]WLI91478.1 DUF3857 domain-containing protein [Massilia sp. R2A-15]
MRLSILLLVSAMSGCFPAIAAQLPAKPAATAADATFSRGGALPKWSQPLAAVPPTTRTDPVVMRLAETQAIAGPSSGVLVNQALQVNDQGALATIGQYSFNYYPSYQKVRLHRVAILRGGQVLDRTGSVNVRLLERETAVEAGVYGGAKTVQLLLEDVRVGDTLWITYSTEGRNPVFDKRWAEDFSWDRDVPVELRRLTILHPARQPLYWRQLGDASGALLAPVIDQLGDMERMRFEGAAIDAVEQESSVPPDFLPVRMLQVSEYPDWQSVAGWADGLFPPVQASPGLRQLAAKFGAGPTPMARASTALHWVQDEIRYFSVSIGQNSHRPQAPDVVLARRFGDCKDKTYLLVSLLAQMGIAARPVLLDAGAPQMPGKLIPSPSWFDHVIVRIELDGATYFVDPTSTGQRGLLSGLPAIFPGAKGLLVDGRTTELLSFPESQDSAPLLEYIENVGIATFDGDAALESRIVYRGHYADWARRHFPPMAASQVKRELLARYEKLYPGVAMVGAPALRDADGRYEVVANFTLPKPVTLVDGKYKFDYDSQIMDDTIGVPAKVVRNFPFALPSGKFHGRYRLSLRWPETYRANDEPIAKTLDTPWFVATEEYALRGNLVDYMLDYRIKTDRVAPEAMRELSVKAKALNPFASGNWGVAADRVALPAALAHSYRNFETVLSSQAISEWAAKVARGEPPDFEESCEVALRSVHAAALQDPFDKSSFEFFPDRIAKWEKGVAARRCQARLAFARGRFADSVALFNADGPLKDADHLLPTLAWARFSTGDGAGALADMARYRTARGKAGDLNGFDIAASIALLQRMGQPLPEELTAYGKTVPDGPWPRPLVAMQAGAIGEEEVLAIAARLPRDARDLALNDAWFYIGQRRFAAGDRAGAAVAFRWFAANGIPGAAIYPVALHELAGRQAPDADVVAGRAAARVRDVAGAMARFRAAAARGNPEAQFELASASFVGVGTAQDFAEARRLATLAADQGHAGAINLMGNIFLEGRGAPKDEVKALAWYRRAAGLGDALALHNIGNCYRFGYAGMARDPVKAFGYIHDSAEMGNARAQAALSQLYAAGEGTAANDELALHWARRAALKGDAAGLRQMAQLVRAGRGADKDPAAALTMVRAAADSGDPDSMADLAQLYDAGNGVEKDPRQAFAWIEKAAGKGNANAQLALGVRYQEGLGVRVDPAKAVEWMEKAAAAGHPFASMQLAETFIKGDGVPKDVPRALAYLKPCLDRNERYCQQFMAMLLHFGRGVERDYAAAAEWYRKAADQGMEVSRNNLADLYENGFGVPQDYAQALALYRRAAQSKLPIAFLSIGSLYEKGLGVPVSPQLAYSHYQLAAQARENDGNATEAAQRRDRLRAQLSDKQKADAEALAIAWKPGAPLPGESVQ